MTIAPKTRLQPERLPPFEDDDVLAAFDFCVAVHDIDDSIPSSFWGAMKCPDAVKWLEACKAEWKNLNDMQCFHELWEVVTNSVATARTANQSVVVADVWNSFGVLLRSASNERPLWVTTALPLPSKHEPNSQPSRMLLRVLNAFTIPAYTHRDCVNHPGKCGFYCGVVNNTFPACPSLK
ncbi:hypothetical protein DYB37_007549 [Aphanomyces astaci]|uniref:Uncharacterized protein n=1 Tax=Aphanomyces astaci TaxID=112090 RepID=A0A3R7A2G7_APHAT|nr:hypothetical protein DYB37_007549 [Aphanomyces astaci]